jgi:hypothetical protein
MNFAEFFIGRRRKMKKCLLMVSAMIILSVSCMLYIPADDVRYPSRGGGYYNEPAQNYTDVNTSYFYNYLSPYGSWVYMRPHGYVWIPRHMGYRWRPYTYGRWVWTDYGWTWISEYEWGWVPFHYGRWGWDDDFGWFWVPGTVWGPAWVIWRSSDLYMGWAPLPPDAEFGMGIGLSGYFDIPSHYWIFIEGRYFLEPRLYTHALPYERNLTIVNYTMLHKNIVVRDNKIINEGIDANVIRNVTGKSFSRELIRDEARPGLTRAGAGEVRIFRPTIRKDEQAKPKEYLSTEEARGKLSGAKIFESNQQWRGADETAVITKRHIEEERLLEKSQQADIQATRKKLTLQQQHVTNAAEKEKIRKELEANIQELKQKHDAEKAQLKERQKKDAQEVEKGRIKKKESGRS